MAIILLIFGLFAGPVTGEYWLIALCLPFAGGLLYWLSKSPLISSVDLRPLGHTSVGEWVAVRNEGYFADVVRVEARFDDYSLTPGPVIRLALANGEERPGLTDDQIAIATVKPPWNGHAYSPENFRDEPISDELYEVVAEAFDRKMDPTEADYRQPQPSGSDAAKKAAALGLLEAGRGRRRYQFKCTDAGIIWVLAAARERGLELVPDSNKPQERATYDFRGAKISRSKFTWNSGVILGNITNSLNDVNEDLPGAKDVIEGLGLLAHEAASDANLSEKQQKEVLEAIEMLANAAGADGEQTHAQTSAVKFAFRSLAAAVGASAALTTLWDVWGGPVGRFFGIG